MVHPRPGFALRLTARPLDLSFLYPFRTARGVRSTTTTVLVELEHDGTLGRGEGSPNVRFDESVAGALDFVGRFAAAGPVSPGRSAEFLDRLQEFEPGYAAAKSAIDIALHDWSSKREGSPLWRSLGESLRTDLETCFTIGFDEPEVVARRTAAADAYPVLKLKVGLPGDREVVEAVRGVTDKPIRVDANEGWTSRGEALERIEWLAGAGTELVEQPLPAGRLADVAWLRRRSPLPLFADEDCLTASDVPALVGAYDGVNVKLDKAGGLREAHRAIAEARRCGLGVMVGCMAASSLGITAAAHLAQAADLADLDSPLLLATDPFRGVAYDGARLVLPAAPGLGVEPR